MKEQRIPFPPGFMGASPDYPDAVERLRKVIVKLQQESEGPFLIRATLFTLVALLNALSERREAVNSIVTDTNCHGILLDDVPVIVDNRAGFDVVVERYAAEN